MKIKNLLVLLAVMLLPSVKGQIITTQPDFITADASAVIVYDASQGTAGLQGSAGPVYAHIGVITDKSTSDSDWKYVLTPWPSASNLASANTDANRLVSLGADKWQLSIKPDIRQFFSVPASETIKSIALVFRNADGSAEGKGDAGADIIIPVYQSGLQLIFSRPASSAVLIEKGETLDMTLKASKSATITLSLGQTQIASKASVTELSASYKFAEEGFYTLNAKASAGSESADTTLVVNVRGQVVEQPRPASWNEGINLLSATSTGFCLYAPGKSFVYLLGDFNNWEVSSTYQMIKDGDYFWLQVDNLKAGEEYSFQYYVDGSVKAGDPYCEKILDPWNDKYISSDVYPDIKDYPTGKGEGLVSVFSTTKQTYNWQVTGFEAPSSQSLNIYELHLRDFTSQGTLKAAEEKLDYIENLGINAIQLMPVQEFDGNDSWGYNPNFYFAPDKAYGTKDDYKHFVDECHKRGIAVILDVVFNHSWGQNPMIKMWFDSKTGKPSADSPYAYPDALHPYNVGYDLKHEAATRQFFSKVLKFWLTEYKVDGFRFDLSKGITTTNYGSNESAFAGYDAQRIEILKGYNAAIKSVNANAYTILEHFADKSEEQVLANDGMMLWRNLNNAYCQAIMGFSADSDFSGMYTSTTQMPACSLVGYMESHDEQRMFYKAKTWGAASIKDDLAAQISQAKLCALFAFMVPGPKMVWQFGELGYDVDIDENGRTGRKPLHWEYYDDATRRELYDFYARLLNLRKNNPDMFSKSATLSWSVGTSTFNSGRRLELKNADNTLLLLANFSTSSVSITPAFSTVGTWYDFNDESAFEVSNSNKYTSISVPSRQFKGYSIKTFNTSVEDVREQPLNVWYNGSEIVLSRELDSVMLYSLQGTLIGAAENTDRLSLPSLSDGYYILKTSEGTVKVVF